MARRRPVTRRNDAVNRARQLRREPSPPEYRLWQALRLRPEGLKFRRQHPFDRCTADFFCPAARLVVEVDGDSHNMGDNPERDARRDSWLRSLGLTVLRFDARDVMKDVGSVVQAIVFHARR
ncbi:MAG TPA: endonuclease domain-containing protein [Allosphingosinicella sp.]|jgi:very-short-patch-repair endonuclease|nr:endonuclease domain-containing protein [Allosphingosinicella sp.]